MSRVTTNKYYCDRCGKEIPFEHVTPTFAHYLILGNSWRILYESKERRVDRLKHRFQEVIKQVICYNKQQNILEIRRNL